MINIKTILYPTDFSEHSAHARPYAVEFAKTFGAKIILLHTTQAPSHYEVAYNFEMGIDAAKIAESAKQAAEKALAELAESISAEGIEVEQVITVGSAFVDIVGEARKRNADIIILSTHGHGMMKHVLLGSTAERVVRKAPCPVLTIRNPEHEFVHP